MRWEGEKVGHTTAILRMDSTSIELARVIARASTTIPMRPRSAGSESEALEVVVSFIVAGEDSGQGEGDDERTDFFPVFRRDPEAGCSCTLISAAESTESVSTRNFLGARISIPPVDRRFADIFVGSHGVSRSKSDSGVDCLVSDRKSVV